MRVLEKAAETSLSILADPDGDWHFAFLSLNKYINAQIPVAGQAERNSG